MYVENLPAYQGFGFLSLSLQTSLVSVLESREPLPSRQAHFSWLSFSFKRVNIYAKPLFSSLFCLQQCFVM